MSLAILKYAWLPCQKIKWEKGAFIFLFELVEWVSDYSCWELYRIKNNLNELKKNELK